MAQGEGRGWVNGIEYYRIKTKHHAQTNIFHDTTTVTTELSCIHACRHRMTHREMIKLLNTSRRMPRHATVRHRSRFSVLLASRRTAGPHRIPFDCDCRVVPPPGGPYDSHDVLHIVCTRSAQGLRAATSPAQPNCCRMNAQTPRRAARASPLAQPRH